MSQLIVDAVDLGLISIASFVLEKFRSLNPPVCDDTARTVTKYLSLRLKQLDVFSYILKSRIVEGSIEIFKYMSLRLNQAIRTNSTEHSDYHEVINTMIHTCSLDYRSCDAFSALIPEFEEILKKSKPNPNVQDRCGYMKNILFNAYMATNEEYVIPMLALCCFFNSVKIAEYLFANFKTINEMYVKNWRLSANFLKTFKIVTSFNVFLGSSMIGIASQCTHIEMIELLVKNGANPNILGDVNTVNVANHWQNNSFLS